MLLCAVMSASPSFALMASDTSCRYMLDDASGLYALCGEGGKTNLSVIERSTGGTLKLIPLGVPATGLMRTMRPGVVLVYWQAFVPSKIGVEVAYALYTLDVGTGELKPVYTDNRIGFGRKLQLYRGWAATSEIDTEAILVDYISPPAAPAYMKILAVDYMTGKVRELARSANLDISADLALDGRRLAFILPRDEYLVVDTLLGTYRQGAWKPSGVLITPQMKATVVELKLMLLDGLINEEQFGDRRLKALGDSAR